MSLKLGKLPATPPRSTAALYAELRPALAKAGVLPKVPASFGYGHDFAQGKWLMLGNGPDDTVFPGFGGCGDCAWAAPAHEEMEAAYNAKRPIPTFSGKTVVAQYSAYSGYDPKTGQNDTGSNIQDVLEWRQTKGIYDDAGNAYKIGKTVAGEPGNVTHLLEMAYLFENADIGIVVTEAQMEQFNASRQPTWKYVPGSPVIGGHCVAVMGSQGLISWAEDVYWTHAFIQAQNDEIWSYIDNERYNAVTGEDAEGYTDQDVEKFLVLVAEQKQAA